MSEPKFKVTFTENQELLKADVHINFIKHRVSVVKEQDKVNVLLNDDKKIV